MAVEDHADFAVMSSSARWTPAREGFEVDQTAEDAWMKMANGVLHMTLMPSANSWYMGAAIPDKPYARALQAAGTEARIVRLDGLGHYVPPHGPAERIFRTHASAWASRSGVPTSNQRPV